MIYLLPVVCGLLGWLTNWIAIRSLFRPRSERRLLGARVPFTPGLLVRKQADIAGKLGAITGREFLDGDRLCDYVFRRIGLADSAGFTSVLSRNLLGRALADLDLGGLVEERLNALDPASLEELIYEAMRRELRYIEVLGGVIGFAVGTVQLLLLL